MANRPSQGVSSDVNCCDDCGLPEPIDPELVAAFALTEQQWAVLHQWARASRYYREQMGDAFELDDEVAFVHWVREEQRLRGQMRGDQRDNMSNSAMHRGRHLHLAAATG